MKIKHSKYKNTGILFELLIRKVTSDTLSGNDSPAVKLLKKYFVNTEIGKEYKLYEALFSKKNITSTQSNAVLSTVLEASKKLNKTSLRKEKYNLIKEIKEHYNLDNLFKVKLESYKPYASFSILLESQNDNQDNINPSKIVDIKLGLLEYLSKPTTLEEPKEDVLDEYKNYDKDLRILTYRILLEKFNTKYSSLNSDQKRILKEYINSIDSTPQLKELYNTEVYNIKGKLKQHIKDTKDKVIKIKLQEVSKLMEELDKKSIVKNHHLVDLLQYHNLLEELSKTNV